MPGHQLTFRWTKSCPSRDWVPFDMIAAFELLAIWRRDQRHRDAVTPTVTISPGSGQDQEVLGLLAVLHRPRTKRSIREKTYLIEFH